MVEKNFHIAQFGTYDIESLGDTTFPKVLSYGLRKYLNCEIELFSMTECATPYNHNSHVYSFEQFAQRHQRMPFDAIIIGGGEFLHFKGMQVIINDRPQCYPNGYIWKRPLELARQFRIPAYFNCVGVAYDFTQAQQKELLSYMDTVRSVTVRDHFSEMRLRMAGIPQVRCVADNLWYLNEMYPRESLIQLRKKLEQRTGRDFQTPYVIVQYGTTRAPKILTQQLLKIQQETGWRICLMPVNYCHEDRTGMQLLAQQGEGRFEVIDDYFQPEEMMAVISGANAFIGTSLHGNLTSASYGVPFVGIDMYSHFVSKMDGIFTMIGCEEYLVPNEAGVAAAFLARIQKPQCSERVLRTVTELQKRLDDHFQRIAMYLQEDR